MQHTNPFYTKAMGVCVSPQPPAPWEGIRMSSVPTGRLNQNPLLGEDLSALHLASRDQTLICPPCVGPTAGGVWGGDGERTGQHLVEAR